ncbi:predicted protein [Naegleria gruberi]|uniref:Predicted protein n=1 Tax=Naegleria gruberi TaxID=5762 RepID=D2V7W8_NAEGR|nr:uncharacterized protein NAEGRDRAFT_64949 [Naegleria gruberi]EFC47078.1 predicted protein [Naegleria gruberi]|eukprot:XP_002679822.1 predicted protein [Naegleria gruberi strain NEG-M]
MVVGKSKQKRRRCIDPFYFKTTFLVKSPYFEYSKTKHDEYASISTPKLPNSTLDFPLIFTPVTRAIGKTASKLPTHEKVLNRSIETFAPDIMSVKSDLDYNVINLKIYTISERGHAEADFNGFRLTKEKLASIPHKFHTLITLNQVYKSLDGYQVRIFMSATTRARTLQLKKTSYANKSQIKKIRTVMHQTVEKHIKKMKIHDFVERMAVKGGMSKEICQQCENIYPVNEEILITKIKVVERPPREEK